MKHWITQYEGKLKIAIIGIALVVAIVVVHSEMKAQREFFTMSAQQDKLFEEQKPFYDCLLASAALADENSPDEDQLAAIEAGNDCYPEPRLNVEK